MTLRTSPPSQIQKARESSQAPPSCFLCLSLSSSESENPVVSCQSAEQGRHPLNQNLTPLAVLE